MGAHKRNVNPSFEPGLHPIDTISYGVQDLVYTRWSCVDMASIEKHALAEFLRWSLWRTRPSSAATEEPADTRSSVSPSSATRDKLLADSPSLSPTPFRCYSAARTWWLSLDRICLKAQCRFLQFAVLQTCHSDLVHTYPAGLLQDHQVDAEEEADQVCNRLAHSRGDRAGPQERARHRVLRFCSSKPIAIQVRSVR